MTHRQALEDGIAKIRACAAVSITRCELGAPVSEDDLTVIEMFSRGNLAQPLLDLYRQLNGARIAWICNDGKQPTLAGDMNFLPIRQATLGWSVLPDGQPFEGVLWSKHFAPSTQKRLKKMGVLESVSGEPTFVTFDPSGKTDALWLVDMEEIRPLACGFETAINTIFSYVGLLGLREKLCDVRWIDLIAIDPTMVRARQLFGFDVAK